jgi:nanoRNase/pAp phosphatase (c-di-AMP/oligoRNAs hydrolase)
VKKVRLVGGGAILRAENRHMVKLLEPPLELVNDLAVQPGTAVVLVDCGVKAENYLNLKGQATIVAAIDHHQSSARHVLPFEDIRPSVAASATIAASYLRQQQLLPNTMLATALLYALRTETRGCQTYYSGTDRAILLWLTRLADPQLLAEIEDAPLPLAYYSDLALALQNVFTYDGVAFCLLPQAQCAEIVGEVADLLIRCEPTHRVFCGAVVDDDIVVSVRTDAQGGNATELLRRTLAGLGRSGGHSNRAGGKISGQCSGDRFSEGLPEELRRRWLEACGVERQRGTRLVPRREIVKHL